MCMVHSKVGKGKLRGGGGGREGDGRRMEGKKREGEIKETDRN